MSLGGIASGNRVLSIPVCFFHECEGLTVTVELRSGELYRGRASNTEDNFNLHMDNVTITPSRGGPPRTLDKVFVRGSSIVFLIFPDVLERSPLFQRVRNAAEGKIVAKGLGVARQAAMRAKSAYQQAEAQSRAGGGGPGQGPPPQQQPPSFGGPPPPGFIPPPYLGGGGPPRVFFPPPMQLMPPQMQQQQPPPLPPQQLLGGFPPGFPPPFNPAGPIQGAAGRGGGATLPAWLNKQ